jgi:hypothetical protein
MRRASPWLAAVFFAAFVGLGYFYLYREARMALQAADAEAGRQAREARLASLRQQLKAAQADQARAAQRLAEAAKAPPAAPAARPPPVVLHLSDLVRDHPELGPIRQREARRNMIRQYGAVLASLNLPPETLARLKDLLVHQMMASDDAGAAAMAQGLERGTPAWRVALQQATADLQDQITATLQTATTLNWAQLQARVAFNNQVQYTYAPEMSLSGAPLTAAQSQGLLQAIADANYAGKDLSTRPANYNERDPATGLTPHDVQIQNNAAASLTPEQIQILETQQIQAAEEAAIYREYGGQNQIVQFVP